jgi:hypothetical protein
MRGRRFSDADLAYICANFTTLETLCAGRAETPREVRALIAERQLPGPSYVLEDGTGMFPPDYFRLLDEAGEVARLREHFGERHRAARARHAPADELEDDWNAYLDGIYGVCLVDVTPEAMVRKTALVSSLCELLMLPRPGSAGWRRELRDNADELDALERDFAPDFDRGPEQERPPTRDLVVLAARERFPEVFDE